MSIVTRTRLSHPDHRFYAWSGIAAAILVFAGFAPSYYLRAFFATHALPLLVHMHGALMTLWLVLFLTQVNLVAAHRTDLHRRLGLFGGFLAGLIVIVGFATAFVAAAREVHDQVRRAGTLMFLGLGTSDLVVFALLVGIAVVLRHRSDFHKRLMLLATLSVVPAGIGRIPIPFVQGNVPVALGLTDLFVIAVIVIDAARNRRLHPAFGSGATFAILTLWLAYFGARTQTWMTFAAGLVT